MGFAGENQSKGDRILSDSRIWVGGLWAGGRLSGPLATRRIPKVADTAEHRIRLRGGWELIEVRGAARSVSRIELPLRSSREFSGRLSLRRRFGRPPMEEGGADVRLRLDQVPGLLCARLNGLELGPGSSGAPPHELPLPDLLPRNELVLELVGTTLAEGWGEVSLVFRTADRPPAGSAVRPLA
jgi:hypothetical protein